jgi:putative holliday junction resolvase
MQISNSQPFTILGLDLGNARAGVARANSLAQLPEPVSVIANNDTFHDSLAVLISDYDAKMLVVGVPLNDDGSSTEQSRKIQQTMQDFARQCPIPVVFVDESHTSKMADAHPTKFAKVSGQNDADAACYILERYFREGPLHV